MAIEQEEKMLIRSIVRGVYDIQKLRIQMGNRVVANFKAKLGQTGSMSEKDLEKAEAELLGTLRKIYEKITDGVVVEYRNFKGDGLISTYSEFCLVEEYMKLEESEQEQFKRLKPIVEHTAIWENFLKGVVGIGPAIAGVIISELDPAEARHVSCFWKYAGVDVAPDGKGRSRRDEHLVEREYVDKDGNTKTKKGITFNPFLKTKLMGVAAGCFLKCGEKSPYSHVYRNYKNRLENHAVYGIQNEAALKKEKGKLYSPKAHRHNMAMRYMIKIFLQDLWIAWRGMEGLPVTEPYPVAKLGYPPHGE